MTKIQFQKVENREGKLAWLAARQVEMPGRVFVWVPNTKRWHRMPELEPDPRYIEDLVFVDVDREQAEELYPTLKPMHGTTWKWLLDQFKAQPLDEKLLSAQLGLKGARPLTGVTLEDVPTGGAKIDVAVFDIKDQVNADQLAREIKAGKRRRFPKGSVQVAIHDAGPGRSAIALSKK